MRVVSKYILVWVAFLAGCAGATDAPEIELDCAVAAPTYCSENGCRAIMRCNRLPEVDELRDGVSCEPASYVDAEGQRVAFEGVYYCDGEWCEPCSDAAPLCEIHGQQARCIASD
jgi:hypothetical protein